MTRLIDASGDARIGIFAEPITEVNYRDFDLRNPFGRKVGPIGRYFGFNQFQFLGALCEDLVFGCAIADVKYAGTAFVYLYEPAIRRFSEYSFRAPLARGVQCDSLPETGSARFHSRQAEIWMGASSSPRERRLSAQLSNGLSIDAHFSEEEPRLEPMYICTPAGATGWVYARKTAGHRVYGTLRHGDRTFDLAAIGALGHHDWSAGYMRRHTFWNWGCLAGRLPDGRVVGMNVSCGVNETSFTENCFWLDGQLHKIDTVCFTHDRRDVLKPWRLTSYDQRLDLAFEPEGRHSENLNAFILASNFNQLVGRYTGTLVTGAGERIPIGSMLGYAERHYAKW